MKCPKCRKEGCKYEESWKDRINKLTKESRNKQGSNWRTNFKAKCKKCGWEGII